MDTSGVSLLQCSWSDHFVGLVAGRGAFSEKYDKTPKQNKTKTGTNGSLAALTGT